MSRENLFPSEKLSLYIRSISVKEHPGLVNIRENTESHPCAKMQIMPEQGWLISMLIKMIGAKKTLEVGVFTGYSSLAAALALPSDGVHYALDHNHEWTSRAQKFWEEAGFRDRIVLKLGEGLDLLQSLVDEGHCGSFDFMFIDADKKNYINYLEYAIKLVRTNGVILADNTLWRGLVIRKDNKDLATEQIREFNQKVFHDSRVEASIIPVADGMTLMRKV